MIFGKEILIFQSNLVNREGIIKNFNLSCLIKCFKIKKGWHNKQLFGKISLCLGL